MSPLLFSLYISELGEKINSLGKGVEFGAINLAAILFADDLVLVSYCLNDLKYLVRVAKDYLQTLDLAISEKKTKIMVYCSKDGDTKVEFLGSRESDTFSLDQVLSFKYLGIKISSSSYGLLKDYNAV